MKTVLYLLTALAVSVHAAPSDIITAPSYRQGVDNEIKIQIWGDTCVDCTLYWKDGRTNETQYGILLGIYNKDPGAKITLHYTFPGYYSNTDTLYLYNKDMSIRTKWPIVVESSIPEGIVRRQRVGWKLPSLRRYKVNGQIPSPQETERLER